MPSIKSLKDLLRCRRGNALVLTAAFAPLLIGGAAVGVDTIQVTFAKRTLQRMADSAAIAGTFGVARSGSSDAAARTAARTNAVNRDLALNDNIVLSGAAQVSQPTTGAFASDANAVHVVLTATRQTPFMSFFGRGDMTVEVAATATLVASGRYCVITLAEDGTGVEFAGSTEVRLGCGVSSNSTNGEAIKFNGNNAQATASPVAAPGGVPDASRFTGTTTTLPGSLPVANPFSHLADPVYPDPTVTPAQPTECGAAVVVEPNTSPPPLVPGCYTGLTLKGNVTLNPGVYYIGSGGLEINSNGTVTGNGVTFLFLQDSGPVSVNGGNTMTLTAPTTGPYAGILMQRHSLAPEVANSFSGNSGTTLDGAIYMPSHHVTMTGNSGWGATCLRLVSERATFTGDSLLTNGCTRPDDNGMVAGYVARLVG